jgi:TolB-like protein/Tfp pilus assembly protein PilF
MSFFDELKRRNVLRVGLAYVVASWLVIQVVETILPAFGFGPEAVRWAVILLAALAIPVLVFAWVYELTPEGLKRERDIDRTRSTTAETGKRLDRLIMIVLALALACFAIDRFLLDPVRDTARMRAAAEQARGEALAGSFGDRSLAVLPFVDLSPGRDQEYFSDGISEELLNLLAKIPELRVTARTSAFSYKGKDVTIREIGRALGVAHVLEGSVRKAGDQVRVTAQLIDARSDTHLWSETYDRKLENIFAVQDEIAAAVVDELKLKLFGATPKSIETDPAAYSMFLRARYLRRQNSTDSLEQAATLLERALELDPQYLSALDDLTTVYINQANTNVRPFEQSYEQARALTQRARAIDPDYWRVYAQLGWIDMYFDNDLKAAGRDFMRALELNPHDSALIGDVSTFLFVIGRQEDAIDVGRYSLELDPVHPVAWANFGIFHLSAGHYREAIEPLREALELSPGYGSGQYLLGQALLGLGDIDDALAATQKEKVDVYRLAGLAMGEFARGDAAASDAALNELIAGYETDGTLRIAQVYAYRGEIDSAFEWLDRAVATGHAELAEIASDPMRFHLRDDPRWHDLLVKLGKAPEQLAEIDFDASLAMPGSRG